MNDHDNSRGTAQQRPHEEMTSQVQNSINEETKKTELSQTYQPVGGVARSAITVDAPSQVNQQSIVTVQQLAEAN